MTRMFHLRLLLSAVTCSCGYTAPDYDECDPGRPAEEVVLATFDETLQGMDSPFQAIRAAALGEHSARATAEDTDETIEFILSVEFEPTALLIPASKGCELDELELEMTTRFTTEGGASAVGDWGVTLSAATAQENGARLALSQAELVLGALGVEVPQGKEVTIGVQAHFVSEDDRSQASFEGSGTIATVGGPNEASVVLARFSWEE